MAEVGCKGYFIGFESGNDRVLKFIRKGTTRAGQPRGGSHLPPLWDQDLGQLYARAAYRDARKKCWRRSRCSKRSIPTTIALRSTRRIRAAICTTIVVEQRSELDHQPRPIPAQSNRGQDQGAGLRVSPVGAGKNRCSVQPVNRVRRQAQALWRRYADPHKAGQQAAHARAGRRQRADQGRAS